MDKLRVGVIGFGQRGSSVLKNVFITLETTLPRFYSRDFSVHGTKGLYEEATDSIYLEDDLEDKEYWTWNDHWGNAKDYASKYEHPVWDKYLHDGVKEGHGGMDYLVYNEFIEHVISGEPMPIDVYDAVTWMCITPLSEQSIKAGGAVVEIPDFKNRN